MAISYRSIFSSNVFTRAQVALLTRLANSVLIRWLFGDVERSVYDKLGDIVCIKDFGAPCDGENDDVPAFLRAFEYCKENGGLTLLVPRGDYQLKTATAVTSITGGSCLLMDGVSDLRIVGHRGARFHMEAATGRVNAMTLYVSSASEAAGNYAQRVSVENIEFVITRADGFASNLSTILFQGTEDCAVINCRIDHSEALGSSFGISGAGRRNRFIDNELVGVATCFDTSHNEDCTYRGNTCRGMSNAVTAFNHFHDANSTGDMRWQYPMSQDIGSGNLYEDNEIIGYQSGFSIRGMRDSWIQRNRIHDFSANDTTTRNMISLYSEDNEGGTVEIVRNIIIRDNVIYNISNASTGTTRGIFINQSVGEMEVSGVRMIGNIIHDIGGTNAVGISWNGTTDDYQVLQNIVDAATVATPYSFNRIDIVAPTAVGLSPRIVSTADLILEPASGRYVRFGERDVNAGAAVTHSIPIRLLDGTDVHVALVAAPP